MDLEIMGNLERMSALHEGWHIAAGEQFGLALDEASTWPGEGSSAHVKFRVDAGTSEDHIAAALTPAAWLTLHGCDTESCSGDYKIARELAVIVGRGDEQLANEIYERAARRAADLVRRRDAEHVVERLADELCAGGNRHRLDIGRVGDIVREARSEWSASHRDYLGGEQPVGITDGMGAAQELAERRAVLAAIPSTPARQKTTAKKATARRGVKRRKLPGGSTVTELDHTTAEGLAEAEKLRLERGGMPRTKRGNPLAGLLGAKKKQKRPGPGRDVIR